MPRWCTTVCLAAVMAAAAGAASAQVASSSAPAAGVAPDAPRNSRDPWEHTNRKLYNFNTQLDRALIHQPILFYHRVTPRPVRNALHNAMQNLTGPIIFVNDVLQLRPKRAAVTAGRFVVNTTLGVAGFNDVANEAFKLPYHNADFGQTLGRYGVGTGPYLFIPVLGPSTVRDLFGRGVDSVADPLNAARYTGRLEIAIARTVGGAIDARDNAEPLLEMLNTTAVDPYAFARSAYLQTRASAVRGESSVQSVEALPDFDAEPTPSPAAPPPPAAAPDPSGQ